MSLVDAVPLVDSAAQEIGRVVLVRIKLVRPFPNQPRKYFDARELASLARSIKKYGQLVPGFVKKISENGCPYKYELIEGQRRWHALQMAGQDEMKVIVQDVKNEDDQFLQSVMANFGRADHTPVEIAEAIGKFKGMGMTEAEIADIFAKSQAWVNQHYKIMRLDPAVLAMMSPEIPENARLVFSVALMIADLPKDLHKKVADTIVGGSMKLSQARGVIRRRAEKLGLKVGSPERTPREDYRNLRAFVGRIRRELEVFCEMPQSFFDKAFYFREKEDLDKILVGVERSIYMLQSLRTALNRARKKRKKKVKSNG